MSENKKSEKGKILVLPLLNFCHWGSCYMHACYIQGQPWAVSWLCDALATRVRLCCELEFNSSLSGQCCVTVSSSHSDLDRVLDRESVTKSGSLAGPGGKQPSVTPTGSHSESDCAVNLSSSDQCSITVSSSHSDLDRHISTGSPAP